MPAGALSISVMFRARVHPHCRSRLRDTTPAPWPVFEKIVQAFRGTLARSTLRLPSLKDIIAAEEAAKIEAAASCSGRSRKSTASSSEDAAPKQRETLVQEEVAQPQSQGARSSKRARSEA